MAQFDVGAEAVGAFTFLFKRRNWLLLLPSVAQQWAALVATLSIVLVSGAPILVQLIATKPDQFVFTPLTVTLLVIGSAAIVVVVTIISAFAEAWTTAAAVPALAGGEPELSQSLRRAASKTAHIVAYTVLLLVMYIVSFVTIIGPIVITYFTLYVIPIIVLADRSATQAVGDSFRLAWKHPAETFGLTLALAVAIVVGITVAFVFALSSVGATLAIPAQCVLSTYFAIVQLRFYSQLTTAVTTKGLAGPQGPSPHK
jgi:hypothetical protein